MLNWIFGRDLKTVLTKTQKIRVRGIRFTIKKVNLMSYLDGSKVLTQQYDTHKTKSAKEALANSSVSTDRQQEHLKEVLVAGVVNPKLVFKKEDDGICVDDLFIDMEMVNELYLRILELTYGKKKVKQLISAGKSLLS